MRGHLNSLAQNAGIDQNCYPSMSFPRAHTELLQRLVLDNLARFERRTILDPALRPAAVALALIEGTGGETCFVLTRRTSGLRRHGGQFALPGGRIEDKEEIAGAALRELEEEVGLSQADGQVLGLLDDYATRSGFCMTPVVVWFEGPRTLRLDPSEVAWADAIPLAELSHPDAPHIRNIPESDRPVIGMPLAGTVVHAPTAAILFQLREVALFGRATRVHHFEQPVFAWR
jgi:8-oxo-dGTP pyrophosphatase MutT (NUDIX family)